ncbi:MAG: PepSY-associated TM helix domain-containing protein [Bacteroidota bacterium]
MQTSQTSKFKWRKWNNILHRDIGYIITALTLIYGISGIAVNHVADWNPSYSREKELTKIEPIHRHTREEIVAEALKLLSITEKPQNTFRPDPETLQLFFEGKNYSIDLPTGNVIIETTQPRPVLFEMNQLHLNAPKRAWTYIADLYSFSLIVVAVTGLFVLKGRTGITGRGAWLTAIGVLIPVVYWVYYIYFP